MAHIPKSVKILAVLMAAGLAAGVSGCSDNATGPGLPPDKQEKITISEGVWGNVWFWEGDFMPGPGPAPGGTITPVVREVLVYEATGLESVDRVNGAFYSAIHTRFLTSVLSDEEGFYQVALPPGKYSFFTREEGLYYASSGDGQGHIQPATVLPGSVTKLRIDITYKATF